MSYKDRIIDIKGIGAIAVRGIGTIEIGKDTNERSP